MAVVFRPHSWMHVIHRGGQTYMYIYIIYIYNIYIYIVFFYRGFKGSRKLLFFNELPRNKNQSQRSSAVSCPKLHQSDDCCHPRSLQTPPDGFLPTFTHHLPSGKLT